jgi:DNA-binding MarR family transcriptional regulator
LNNTVELVRLWGAYEEEHPDASLTDFFRHQVSPAGTGRLDFPADGPLRPGLNGQLTILIRRIGKYHILFSNRALEGTGLIQIEEFGILVSIFNQGNPIKSEVIFQNMMELSSGTNMLARLKKRGLISEYADKEDKRVKRLKITARGEAVLDKGRVRVLKTAALMMHMLSDEDKKQCIRLLIPVHEKFEGSFQKQRSKSFDEIYESFMQGI